MCGVSCICKASLPNTILQYIVHFLHQTDILPAIMNSQDSQIRLFEAEAQRSIKAHFYADADIYMRLAQRLSRGCNGPPPEFTSEKRLELQTGIVMGLEAEARRLCRLGWFGSIPR